MPLKPFVSGTTVDDGDVAAMGSWNDGPWEVLSQTTASGHSYRVQFAGQFCIGAAAWPAVYQYMVYDETKDAGPIFGKFQRMPDEKELNDLQRNGNKRWDLGWVYTVIAGVLKSPPAE